MKPGVDGKKANSTTLIKVLPSSTSLWMFTGQGSLMPGVARALYEANTVFKNALDQYTVALEDCLDLPLLNLLIRNDGVDANHLVQQTQYAQPAIVAVQLAQIAMWNAYDMKPSVVLGHSIGEFAAAVVAGVMQPEVALKLAAIRGRLMSECQPGGMAAVMVPAERFQQFLPKDIVIAAENGPSMTVLAGPYEALRCFVEGNFKDVHTMLPVSHAFHSPLMESAAQLFRNHVEGATLSEPQGICFISTLSGDIETKKLKTAEYWADQIVQPVQFLRAVKKAFSLSLQVRAIVELGPASTLINMAKRIVPDEDLQWISSINALNIEVQAEDAKHVVRDSRQKNARALPLFRRVPLTWNKPSSKEVVDKPNQLAKAISSANGTGIQLNTSLIPHLHKSASITAGDQHDLLLIIRQVVADVIGRSIADDVPLMESGLDSLGSVSLRNRLASRLGVELPSAFALEYPDINSMVRYLVSSSPRTTPRIVHEPSPSGLPVLVIGAGIGGLSFARQLEKANIPVVVMDAADRVGGVWHSLANHSSKLQIDSPAYDFDSTAMPSPDDHSWKVSFPQQPAILEGAENIANMLAGPVYLSARVQKVLKIGDAEYEVTYQYEGSEQQMRVSGVAAMTGGLHHPVKHVFPNEHLFGGHVGLGIANDTPLEIFNGASVVIVGHGAFAVENMRTAFENGAKHVTILCRQRHVVFPTFCNWLLNSSKGVMPVADVVDVLRPFYAACGIDVEDLEALTRDKSGELVLDQTTVPAGSDFYFLAQMLGKLRVVVSEVADFTPDAVITREGQNIPADVFLKCLGSHTDDSVLRDIFGRDSKVQGLWVNGDPNLFAYNDGAQAPRKVKSLMCASYAFFVQAFVPAYLHFRQHRDEFERVLARINIPSSISTEAERVLVELWDFVEPAKRVLAERTVELCPFDRFQVEREREWENYSRMLSAAGEESKSLWQLLRPTLLLIHRRNPLAPTETRSQHPSLGSLSVFVPRRRRVLFLSGQGTNARLARVLLDRTGWIGRSELDFVVPDAPHEMPAFTNEQQLEQIGLDGLVSLGLYDKTARYREWRAGFETLWQHHHDGKPIQVTNTDREQWDVTLEYVREIAERYGPFDGIAGFCEGATVASVALHLQAQGKDHGLGSARFFIAMSPWRSPMHQQEGMFQSGKPLQIPMLQIVGDNDMEVFLTAAPHFRKDFAEASEFRHGGQHVYPPLTPGLEHKLRQLLNTSDERLYDRTYG